MRVSATRWGEGSFTGTVVSPASDSASSSRSSSSTACSRFSGGLVKYTCAQRPRLRPKVGFSMGFNSGLGSSVTGPIEFPCESGKCGSPDELAETNSTPTTASCQFQERSGNPVGRGGCCCRDLVADLAGGRLKLVHLRIVLACNLALRGFAVQIRARAIIQSGVHIHPDRDVRIASIGRSGRRIG